MHPKLVILPQAFRAIAGAVFLMAIPAQAQIEMKSGRIDVVFESNETGVPRERLLAWVEEAGRAVTDYYGRFPVRHVEVRIRSVGGDTIGAGQTFGTRAGGLIKVEVGRSTTEAHFARDWLMTHEMVHLALPDLPERHHWIEEGIATYVEPIARARRGKLSAAQHWAELVRDLPQGLPEAGDRGLDFTPTWGRTYWGGALFCLLADVEIHRRTANEKGLEDALRGIQEAGGAINQDWSLERALSAGDRATGVPVLQELYAQMKAEPHPVDLDELWTKMGISRRGRGVTLDDAAPLASVRRAILGVP